MASAKPVVATLLVVAAFASGAQAQVAFQPTVGVFPSGVQMTTTPVVSHDRRYVRLGVVPTFTDLLGFDVFGVPAAVSGGPGGPGALGGIGGLRSTGVGAGDERAAVGGKAIGGAAGPLNPSAAIARAARVKAANPVDRPPLLEIKPAGPDAAPKKPAKARILP